MSQSISLPDSEKMMLFARTFVAKLVGVGAGTGHGETGRGKETLDGFHDA